MITYAADDRNRGAKITKFDHGFKRTGKGDTGERGGEWFIRGNN